MCNSFLSYYLLLFFFIFTDQLSNRMSYEIFGLSETSPPQFERSVNKHEETDLSTMKRKNDFPEKSKKKKRINDLYSSNKILEASGPISSKESNVPSPQCSMENVSSSSLNEFDSFSSSLSSSSTSSVLSDSDDMSISSDSDDSSTSSSIRKTKFKRKRPWSLEDPISKSEDGTSSSLISTDLQNPQKKPKTHDL